MGLVVLRIRLVAVIIRRGGGLGCLCHGPLGNLYLLLLRQVMLGVQTMKTTIITTVIAIVGMMVVGNQILEMGGIGILGRRPDKRISIENHQSCFICMKSFSNLQHFVEQK